MDVCSKEDLHSFKQDPRCLFGLDKVTLDLINRYFNVNSEGRQASSLLA